MIDRRMLMKRAGAAALASALDAPTARAEVDDPLRVPSHLAGVKVFHFAESLGGVESLITYPAVQTHADIAPTIRERLGINDRLLRLSVGIEDVNDLINDLRAAL